MKAKELIIRSRYTEKQRCICESGRPMHNTYEIQIDDRGHKTLIKTGETNLHAKIQESLESTLIENILDRVALGDKEALELKKGQYMDLTGLPKSLSEAQNQIAKIKSSFYELPLEIRAKYDHSPELYVQKYGTKEWMNDLFPEPKRKKLEEPPKEETKDKGEKVNE